MGPGSGRQSIGLRGTIVVTVALPTDRDGVQAAN